MCTVILSFNPGTDRPLVVGANRDENPSRPSEGFKLRNEGKALYPLDVGGGTWIGTNSSGVFAAVTNRDNTKHVRGRRSRGMLVKRALECSSVLDVAWWANQLSPRDYNGFRLIVADARYAVVWGGDGESDVVSKHSLEPGLHVVTGFGLDTWEVPRCAFIKAMFDAHAVRWPCECFSPEIRELVEAGREAGQVEKLKKILSFHATGSVDTDVCVHDPGETHVTVSSCIITAEPDMSFTVESVITPPCRASEWDMWTISAEKNRCR